MPPDSWCAWLRWFCTPYTRGSADLIGSGLDFHFLPSSPSATSDEADSSALRAARGTSHPNASRPTPTPTSASSGGNSGARRTAIGIQSIQHAVVIDSSDTDTDSYDSDIQVAEISRLPLATARPTPRPSLPKFARVPHGTNGGLRSVDSNLAKSNGTVSTTGSTTGSNKHCRQPKLNLLGSKPRADHAPTAPVGPTCRGHDTTYCTSPLVRCTSIRPNGRMCANRYCLDYLDEHQMITDELRNNQDSEQPGILSTAGTSWKCPPCKQSIEQSKRNEEAKRVRSQLSTLSDVCLPSLGNNLPLPAWIRVGTELPYDNIMARVTVYQALVRFQSLHSSLRMLNSLNPFEVWDHDTMDTILTLIVSTIIGLPPTKLKSAPTNLNIPNFPAPSTWRSPHHQRLNRSWSHFALSYRRHQGDRTAQRTTFSAVGGGTGKGKKRSRAGNPLDDDPLDFTTARGSGRTGWVTEYELWDELAGIIQMYNVPIQPLMELQPPREPTAVPTPSEPESDQDEEQAQEEGEDAKCTRNLRKRARVQQVYNEQSDDDEWERWERNHMMTTNRSASLPSADTTMRTQADSDAEESSESEPGPEEQQEEEEQDQGQRRSSRLRRRNAPTMLQSQPKDLRRSARNQPGAPTGTRRTTQQKPQGRTTRASARAAMAQPTGRTTRAAARAASPSSPASTATPESTSTRRSARLTTQAQVDSSTTRTHSGSTSSLFDSDSNSNDSDSSLTDPEPDLEMQMVAKGLSTSSATTEEGKQDAKVGLDVQMDDVNAGSVHDTTLSSPPASDDSNAAKAGMEHKATEAGDYGQGQHEALVEKAQEATEAKGTKEATDASEAKEATDAKEATATPAPPPHPPGLERKISLLQSLLSVALQHPTLHEELRTFLDVQGSFEREERDSAIESREKFVSTKLNPLMAKIQALNLDTERRATQEGQEELDRLYAKRQQLERNFKLTTNKNKLKMYRRRNAVNVRFESLGKDNEQREYWLFDSPSSDSPLPVAKAEWLLGLYVYGKPLPLPPSVPSVTSLKHVASLGAHEA